MRWPRPQSGHCAPGHQTRERHAGSPACAGGGLWDRPGGDCGGRGNVDGDRARHRDAGLHEPRAGRRREGPGWAERHLRARLHAVRDGGGPSAIHRDDGAGDSGTALDGRGAASLRRAADGPAGPRDAIATALAKVPADRFPPPRRSSSRPWRGEIQRRDPPRPPRSSHLHTAGSGDSRCSLSQPWLRLPVRS